MTVENMLATVDAMKPNELCEEVKIRWLCDVEGRVLCEIHKQPPESVKLPESEKATLTVPDAYSRLYSLYLAAMIAFTAGNYEEYTALSTEAEAAFMLYAKHYIRNRA
jgi:hypothetical protein